MPLSTSHMPFLRGDQTAHPAKPLPPHIVVDKKRRQIERKIYENEFLRNKLDATEDKETAFLFLANCAFLIKTQNMNGDLADLNKVQFYKHASLFHYGAPYQEQVWDAMWASIPQQIPDWTKVRITRLQDRMDLCNFFGRQIQHHYDRENVLPRTDPLQVGLSFSPYDPACESVIGGFYNPRRKGSDEIKLCFYLEPTPDNKPLHGKAFTAAHEALQAAFTQQLQKRQIFTSRDDKPYGMKVACADPATQAIGYVAMPGLKTATSALGIVAHEAAHYLAHKVDIYHRQTPWMSQKNFGYTMYDHYIHEVGMHFYTRAPTYKTDPESDERDRLYYKTHPEEVYARSLQEHIANLSKHKPYMPEKFKPADLIPR